MSLTELRVHSSLEDTGPLQAAPGAFKGCMGRHPWTAYERGTVPPPAPAGCLSGRGRSPC